MGNECIIYKVLNIYKWENRTVAQVWRRPMVESLHTLSSINLLDELLLATVFDNSSIIQGLPE